MTSKTSQTKTSQTSQAKPATVKYDVAVERGTRLVTAQSRNAFALGDLAGRVEIKYGKSNLDRFADDIGIKVTTLRNFRTVALAYAPADRSDANPFTIHEIFAPLRNVKAGMHVKLVNERTWSAAEARAKVAEVKGITPPAPADPPAPVDPPAQTETEIERTRRHIAQLESQLANARAKLAELEATEAANAETETEPAPVVHNVRGVPEHAPADNRPDCRECAKAAKDAAPAAEVSPIRRARKPRTPRANAA
jgi:hypothetical protein